MIVSATSVTSPAQTPAEFSPDPSASKPRPQALAVTALVALLIAFGIARIAGTYSVYNQTMDEPEHIAGGLEWWQHGKFVMDDMHVPLGPMLIGIGPVLTGAHVGDSGNGKIEGAAYLNGGNYFSRLTAARVGVLPLFVLAAIVVGLWARRLAGDVAAVCAVLLFTTAPPVLAHAGLATTDTAAEASFVFALFAFVVWLAKPSLKNALLLGFAGGLALSGKLTNVPFLLASGALIVVARLVLPKDENARPERRWWRESKLWSGFALSVVLSFVVLWGMYHFSWGHVRSDSPTIHSASATLSRFAVPAPEFWYAIHGASDLSHTGKITYLLGSSRFTGSAAFFPVALLVKTPIAMLALALIGGLFMAINGFRRGDWAQLAPPLAAIAIMAVAMSSKLNIGLRHILAIYPLLAIIGGIAIAEIWKLRTGQEASARKALAVALVALLGWQVADGVMAHPDYLPWFNQFAAGHGEEILVDSDLDWGQDLFRLSKELQARHIDHLWLSYFGSAEPQRFGITGATELPTFRPVTGWIAISEFHLKKFPTAFAWMRPYRPVTRVGSSILLYYIEPTP